MKRAGPAQTAFELVEAARQMGVTFATAESCTGGLVAHLVTEVPGASAVFLGGWVLYDNRRKVEDLGVDAALIQAHGAVSAEVVTALAAGARARARADFAVATTGIAGPSGGSAEKPVGLVHLGVASPGGVHAEHRSHAGLARTEAKLAFAQDALALLLAAVQGA